MGLLIDFHYSDSWADPQKQYTPAAWKNLPFDQLVTALHDWTRDAIRQMKDAGGEPNMVQIGNEITPGMLWDAADGGARTSN
jgi:arabinogalactan endo-1,4-beta-galactosidase